MQSLAIMQGFFCSQIGVFVSVLYVSALRTLLGRVCVCQSCVDRCVYVGRV